MGYSYCTEVEVDVEIDDILDNISSSEKRELCEQLIEDGYAPRAFADIDRRVETYTDSELQDLIDKMWENKYFFDIKLVDELKKMLRERNII
jgi:hypothetical protein